MYIVYLSFYLRMSTPSQGIKNMIYQSIGVSQSIYLSICLPVCLSILASFIVDCEICQLTFLVSSSL